MSAVEPVVAETSEVPRPPPIVYFWGSVRATVNRVAAEYARRLHAEPVVLVVESTHHRGAAFLIDAGIRPNRLFALRAVEEVQLLPPAPGSEERGALDRRPEEDLQTEAHRVMQLPPIVDFALRAADHTGPGGAFVLANIDRLPQLTPLVASSMTRRLIGSFHQHGTTLILTSKGLLPLPQLGVECAFEVSASPEAPWWDAEIRPGVPVSCCSECPGSVDGAYASCQPQFRVACPVLNPLEAPAGQEATG